MILDYTTVSPGDKIKFLGTGPHWFEDMIENGNKLQVGAIYTLSTKEVFSSHVVITLAETGDLEYSLGWFDKHGT